MEALGECDQFEIGNVSLATFYLGHHRSTDSDARASQTVRKQHLRKLQARALPCLSYSCSDNVFHCCLWRLLTSNDPNFERNSLETIGSCRLRTTSELGLWHWRGLRLSHNFNRLWRSKPRGCDNPKCPCHSALPSKGVAKSKVHCW